MKHRDVVRAAGIALACLAAGLGGALPPAWSSRAADAAGTRPRTPPHHPCPQFDAMRGDPALPETFALHT